MTKQTKNVVFRNPLPGGSPFVVHREDGYV